MAARNSPGDRSPLSRVLLLALAAIGVLAAVRSPRRPVLSGVDPEALAVGYERSDGSVRWIVASGIGLVLTIGLIVGAVTLVESTAVGRPVVVGPPDNLLRGTSGGPAPQPPRLETQPGALRADYARQQDETLSTYRWLDRQHDQVAIPISRAIDLLASESPSSSTPEHP